MIMEKHYATHTIASHNTMTYLPVKHWWMKPFNFIAKCQDKDIYTQYELGIRLFDIRIKWDNKEGWVFAHGSLIYKGSSPLEVFEYLNSRSEKTLVRLILEYNKKPKDEDNIFILFQSYVAGWITHYPNILFFEFRMKYNWKQVYFNPDKVPTYYQAVSSMSKAPIDDLCPWVYASLHNEDIINQGTDKDYLFIDFI